MLNKTALHNNRDVTERILLSDVSDVSHEVLRLLGKHYPNYAFSALTNAFADLERMYMGQRPNFRACETPYHDLPHSLDTALTMARIVTQHDAHLPETERFDAQHVEVGLVIALFHDAGYIRRMNDSERRHGAEYTKIHVTRSANFLDTYLPQVGLAKTTAVARELVHFTGYERALSSIRVVDDQYLRIGHALGTADLLAQMADRCYPEKCRDRLYPEFVAGGMDRMRQPNGQLSIIYQSGIDLVKSTPNFVRVMFEERLDGAFEGLYRHVDDFPYLSSIKGHIRHIEQMTARNDFSKLRRHPSPTPGEDLIDHCTHYLQVDPIEF